MSIEVICPTCDQVHRVKDESAGKKLCCKCCQAVIPIRAASEPDHVDPLGTGDVEKTAARQALGETNFQSARVHPGDGMPIAILVSIAVNGILLAYNVVGIALTLMAGSYGPAFVSLSRLIIELTIISGLRARSGRIRWSAIVLDGIGLTFVFICMGGLYLVAPEKVLQMFAVNHRTIIFGILGMHAVFWIIEFVMLFSPSARIYCDN
jgi:hypothetical protein